jgi:hypothetical protein
VSWGIKAFPATHVALVITDHGGATDGAAWDVTNGFKPLTIVGMRDGLRDGLARSGRERLDLLGFDACLMGNLGVAYELRPFTDVLVLSEEVEPAHGWPYTALAKSMAAALAPRDLAKSIVASFETECVAKKTIDMCTMAAFDAFKLEGVAAALDRLGVELHARMSSASDWTAVARARAATEEYGAAPGKESPYGTIDAVDFGERAAALLPDKTNLVGDALQVATIAAMHGRGKPDAHGLSITFPKETEDRRSADRELAIAKHRGWESFLTSFFEHEAGDVTAPEVTNPLVTPAGGAFQVSATITDAGDVGRTYGVVALLRKDGGLSVLALPLLGQSETSFRWDGRLPAITDGQSVAQVPIFEQPQYADDGAETTRIASLPATLLPKDGEANARDVIVYVKVSAEGRVVIHGVYAASANGPANEVELVPGERLRPKSVALDAKGSLSWVEAKGGPVLRHFDNLAIEEVAPHGGTYAVGLYVADLAGNARAATTGISLP